MLPIIGNCLRGSCVEKLVTIWLTLVYTSLVVIVSVCSVIKNRSKYFQVKRRDAPPNCLQDTSLGSHHYVVLQNVKLHYVSNGDLSKPLIVFIHGFPEFWYSWRHQLRIFAKDYFVVAVDLRGYGESEKPTAIDAYTADKLAEDIRQLILSLNKERAVVIGHDWGGAVSWNVAARYPQMVDKLVILNAPHPLHFRDILRNSWKQFFSSWYMYFFNAPILTELVLLSNDLKIFEEAFTGADGTLLVSNEDIEAYKYTFSRPNALTCPLNYYRALIRGYAYVPANSYRIKCPTLVIWGKRDIALISELAEAGKYCDALTIRYIENCSHWTQQDQPLLVNQYITEFLQ